MGKYRLECRVEGVLITGRIPLSTEYAGSVIDQKNLTSPIFKLPNEVHVGDMLSLRGDDERLSERYVI